MYKIISPKKVILISFMQSCSVGIYRRLCKTQFKLIIQKLKYPYIYIERGRSLRSHSPRFAQCRIFFIKILTLKRITSEVGCHIDSADCHLAVPFSEKISSVCFFLLFFVSLSHQQHQPHQGSSLPSISSSAHNPIHKSKSHFLACA